jgi:1-acyl-sn-glycerol-3-phosphate acyltransferase
LRGVVSLTIIVANTLFWLVPIFLAALVKLAVPLPTVRRWCNRVLDGSANHWIGVNNLVAFVFCNIRWRVSGIDQLRRNDWYLVIANHQSWVDILVLQKIFYRKIPFLKFFLKQQLFWFPFMGLAWWALDFPFMKRYSKRYLTKFPHLKGKDLEITRRACEKFKTIPVSVMNFVEGTRFTAAKHTRQQSPYRHLLLPRAGGIAFVLGAMGKHIGHMLDVTIVYPDGAGTFWAYLCGRVREVRVQVRNLPVTPSMLGDYFNDASYRDAFQTWLNALWQQKDHDIEELSAAPLPSILAGAAMAPPFPEVIPEQSDGMFTRNSSVAAS